MGRAPAEKPRKDSGTANALATLDVITMESGGGPRAILARMHLNRGPGR
jgi:hypothetical protein